MAADKQSFLMPWTLALGMFVIGTTSLSILGVGPALTRDLAIYPSAAGWLVTAFAATFAIAAPVTQFTLGRRVSPRRLILFGIIVLAASLVWAALAGDFPQLLVARITAAIGGALIAPTSAALAIASVPDSRRGAILAIVFGGFTLATVGGVPIATWLTLFLGWRGAMAAIAGVALLFLLLALMVLPGGSHSGTGTAAQDGGGTVHRKLTIILSTTLGMLAAQFTVYALMGELLGQRFDLTDADLPATILLFGILGVAGNAAAGYLSDRMGADLLVWISIASLAALLLVMNADLGPLVGSVLIAGCAFAGTLFTTPQQSRLVALVPKHRHALLLAINSSASYLGIALGSGLASWLAQNIGLNSLPAAAVSVLAITGAINLLASSRDR